MAKDTKQKPTAKPRSKRHPTIYIFKQDLKGACLQRRRLFAKLFDEQGRVSVTERNALRASNLGATDRIDWVWLALKLCDDEYTRERSRLYCDFYYLSDQESAVCFVRAMRAAWPSGRRIYTKWSWRTG